MYTAIGLPGTLLVSNRVEEPRDGARERERITCETNGTLGDEYRAVIVDFSRHRACTINAAASACDDTIVVSYTPDPAAATPAPHSRVLRVVNRADPRSRALPLNDCEPYVLPHEAGLTGLN